MDIVPLDNLEPMEENSYLSDRAIFSRDREIERRVQNPKRKETFLQKLRAANDLIGGVPRLAIEADENPWAFYNILARLESADKTKNVNHNVRFIAPNLPPSALDGEVTDVEFEEVPTPDGSGTPEN